MKPKSKMDDTSPQLRREQSGRLIVTSSPPTVHEYRIIPLKESIPG